MNFKERLPDEPMLSGTRMYLYGVRGPAWWVYFVRKYVLGGVHSNWRLSLMDRGCIATRPAVLRSNRLFLNCARAAGRGDATFAIYPHSLSLSPSPSVCQRRKSEQCASRRLLVTFRESPGYLGNSASCGLCCHISGVLRVHPETDRRSCANVAQDF